MLKARNCKLKSAECCDLRWRHPLQLGGDASASYPAAL